MVWKSSTLLLLLCLAVKPLQAQPAGKAVKVTDQPPHPERVFAEAIWRNLCFGFDSPAVRDSEAAAMLSTILKGGSMGNGQGWFKSGASRYSWTWLAKRHELDPDGRLTRQAWSGPPELFDRLDRDHDGVLTASDFDWSDDTPASREERMYQQWFGKLDADSNGKLSRAEWDRLFERLADGKDYLSAEDLRRAFPLPAPVAKKGGKPGGQKPPPEFQRILLKGFFDSEVGSPFPGPRVDELAPDFTLPTHDGKERITLSDYQGHKPVVLIFGNFT